MATGLSSVPSTDAQRSEVYWKGVHHNRKTWAKVKTASSHKNHYETINAIDAFMASKPHPVAEQLGEFATRDPDDFWIPHVGRFCQGEGQRRWTERYTVEKDKVRMWSLSVKHADVRQRVSNTSTSPTIRLLPSTTGTSSW